MIIIILSGTTIIVYQLMAFLACKYHALLRTASNLITVTQVSQQTDMVAQNNTYSTHNVYTNMICLFGH